MPEDKPGNEVETLDVEEPIPNAAGEVYFHGMTRGAQLGSLAFSLAAIPFHFWRGGGGGRLLLRRMGTASVLGCLGGAAFLFMGVKQKLDKSDAWGVYDRAYRLRNNKGQVLWDQLAYSSASVGAFLGTVIFNGGLWGACVGFSSGLSLGVVEFVVAKKLVLKPEKVE